MRFPQFGTASDVAIDHGVTRGAVAQWIRNHSDAPTHVQLIRGGRERLYVLDEWRAFCKQKGLGKR